MRKGAEAPGYAERSIEPQPKDRGNTTQNNQPIEEELYSFNRTVIIFYMFVATFILKHYHNI